MNSLLTYFALALKQEIVFPSPKLQTVFFSFESENGITRTEDGFIKAVPDSKYPAQVMSGSYSYTGPDGNVSFAMFHFT